MKRREAREKAIQTLFQLDSGAMDVTEAIGYVMDHEEDGPLTIDPFYEKLVRGTVEHMNEIDKELAGNLSNWSLERLPKIERTVLRMALFEMRYIDDVPEKVALNEAIELCKLYGDEKSGRFVNGVLSKFS